MFSKIAFLLTQGDVFQVWDWWPTEKNVDVFSSQTTTDLV